MSVIKVRDLAYGRLRAPDLDAEEEFLTAFGMVRAERTPHALYMRGTDPNHHIHITEKGDPAFLGFAWYAASEDDLKTVAKLPGASAINLPTAGTGVTSCADSRAAGQNFTGRRVPSPTTFASRSLPCLEYRCNLLPR